MHLGLRHNKLICSLLEDNYKEPERLPATYPTSLREYNKQKLKFRL